MAHEVVICGAGGFGREVLDAVRLHPSFSCAGFFDNWFSPGEIINGSPVLGNFEDLVTEPGQKSVLIALGDSVARASLFSMLKSVHLLPVFANHTAFISPYARIGDGAIIQGNCIVAANAEIGVGFVMNANSGVGHDATVGDFCSVMSFCDVAGGATLGDNCFMGSGAKVSPKIVVGSNSFICAGSILVRDFSQNSKIMGNPAKKIGEML